MVLASRASGCLFGHPNPWKEPLRTPNFLCGISKNFNLKLIIEFFHLLTIPTTLFNDIMPYFDELTHVYGWNMSILWSPLKIWTPNLILSEIIQMKYIKGSNGYVLRKFAGFNSAFFWLVACFETPFAHWCDNESWTPSENINSFSDVFNVCTCMINWHG